MELIWLAGAIIGAGAAVYFLIIKDSDSALYFVAFFVISVYRWIMTADKEAEFFACRTP